MRLKTNCNKTTNKPIISKTKTMENKKPILFIFWVIAIILGVTLFKQFDFKTFKFEKPALDFIYLVVFLFSVFIIIKNSKKK